MSENLKGRVTSKLERRRFRITGISRSIFQKKLGETPTDSSLFPFIQLSDLAFL